METHQYICWLDDRLWVPDMFLLLFLNGAISPTICNILYNLDHQPMYETVCCDLKWMPILLFSERNPDLHQSRLLQCSRYVWSNLSLTLIWCAWGVLTAGSDILPEEENAVTSQDLSLLQSWDNWLADRLCKPNRDYCLSSCMQIHPFPYHSRVLNCPLDFAWVLSHV